MNSNIPPVQDQVHVTQVKSTNVHVPTPKFFMPVFLTIIVSTPVQVKIRMARIRGGGGLLPSGGWTKLMPCLKCRKNRKKWLKATAVIQILSSSKKNSFQVLKVKIEKAHLPKKY